MKTREKKGKQQSPIHTKYETDSAKMEFPQHDKNGFNTIKEQQRIDNKIRTMKAETDRNIRYIKAAMAMVGLCCVLLSPKIWKIPLFGIPFLEDIINYIRKPPI